MEQATDDFSSFGPQVIFGMDPQGRCTLSVGPGLEALGLQPGQLVGQDLLALYSAPEDHGSLQRALAGESFSTQGWMHGRLLQTSYHAVHGADGSLESVVGVATDITEHVRAHEELSRFKALADDSEDLIAIADQAGRPTYLNPRLAALDLPLSADELWASVAELAGDAPAAELRARLQSGERWSGDLTLALPAGDLVIRAEVFPLHGPGRSHLLGTGLIARDITGLRASEAALRATNADLVRFQALVETSGDFIAIAGLDGVVQYVNPAGRALVGIPEDLDVRTTTIHDYLTPEGIERSERVEQPAVIEHGRWRGESTLRGPGGSAIPVEISSFLIRDPETGAPLGLATVQQDITERLAAARAHDEFVVMVAHELRTPLTSVRGYVEIAGEALESQADPVRLAAHLGIAGRNIARMERLVEQILRVAGEDRRHRDERRHRDLTEVATQSAEAARPEVERAGLRLELEAPGSPLPVLLDETFPEVVDNLLSNATKFTPAGGAIVVRLERDDEGAVLSVDDTGPGVAPEEIDTIFEKFVRGGHVADRPVPGLGLGLYLTRGIVAAHEGRISVEQAPVGGARFVVRLPLAEPPL